MLDVNERHNLVPRAFLRRGEERCLFLGGEKRWKQGRMSVTKSPV